MFTYLSCRWQVDDVPADGRGDRGQVCQGVSVESRQVGDQRVAAGRRPRLDSDLVHQTHPGLRTRSQGHYHVHHSDLSVFTADETELN